MRISNFILHKVHFSIFVRKPDFWLTYFDSELLICIFLSCASTCSILLDALLKKLNHLHFTIYMSYNYILYEYIKNTSQFVLVTILFIFFKQQVSIYILLQILTCISLTTSSVTQIGFFCLRTLGESSYVLSRQLTFPITITRQWVAMLENFQYTTYFPSHNLHHTGSPVCDLRTALLNGTSSH